MLSINNNFFQKERCNGKKFNFKKKKIFKKVIDGVGECPTKSKT